MSKSTKNAGACPLRKTSIGGQALMEGIMMRGPAKTAMAVRNPQGEIVLEECHFSTKKRPKFFRLPFIRGIFGFIDSMTLGYKCLMRSAEISGLEEIEAEMEKEKAAKKAAKKAKKMGKGTVESVAPSEDAATEATNAANDSDAPANPPKEEKKGTSFTTTAIMIFSVIFAVAIMVGLFIWLPTFLYKDVLEKHISWMPKDNRYLQSAFEGILRVLFLVGYMGLMSLMKDIRRTFQYHGAEHKTIFCYEQGLELTVENVRKQKRFHPRCGTSFLILMMLVSIVVGFFIPPGLGKVLRTVIRICLIPVIMGLGFELIKICGRFDNWLTRIISFPGVALQHITVFEPDDSMIECAIAAMKEVIPDDDSDAW
jgi:uncharacterized protein YqhQ